MHAICYILLKRHKRTRSVADSIETQKHVPQMRAVSFGAVQRTALLEPVRCHRRIFAMRRRSTDVLLPVQHVVDRDRCAVHEAFHKTLANGLGHVSVGLRMRIDPVMTLTCTSSVTVIRASSSGLWVCAIVSSDRWCSCPQFFTLILARATRSAAVCKRDGQRMTIKFCTKLPNETNSHPLPLLRKQWSHRTKSATSWWEATRGWSG